jgi:hypothetical protein
MNQIDRHIIYHHLPLQDSPKFTQIGIFGLKNMPSGNPASDARSDAD